MRAVVVLNAGAGALQSGNGAELKDRIVRTCLELGVAADVRAVPAAGLKQEIERAAADSAADVLILGGGDGSIKTGAAALAGTGRPLGLLPLGTLNHFARDLGIPPGIEDALRTAVSGQVREVDVAEVNGVVFVNNCSLGLYPEAVRQRERLRRAKGVAKWAAMGRGAWEALRGFRVSRLTLITPQANRRLATPQLVVGNNRYETTLLKLGRRSALDRGELWVYAALDRGRFGFLRLVWRTLLGRLDQGRDFESLCAAELELEGRRPRQLIRLALDGEVLELRGPLRFRSRPGALKVIAPPPPAPS